MSKKQRRQEELIGTTYEDELLYRLLRGYKTLSPSPEEIEAACAKLREKKLKEKRESCHLSRGEEPGRLAETVTTPRPGYRKYDRSTD